MKKNNNPDKFCLRTFLINLMVCLAVSSPWAQSDKLNVIMIIVDDLRDHKAFTPFEVKTPNFDKLAAKGLRFDRAYANFPVCNSSRASFMSGLRPPTTRVVQNTGENSKLDPDIVKIPRMFKDAGYYTISIGKILHTNMGDEKDWTRDREFVDEYMDHTNYRKEADKYKDDPNLIFLNDNTHEYIYKGPEDLEAYGYTDHHVAQDVNEFLDEAVNMDKPFFLAAGYKKPHNPYIGPASYFDIYPPETLPLVTEPDNLVPPYDWATPKSSRETFKAMDKYHQQMFIGAYAAMTTFADSQFGLFMDKMDEHNLWDNTIVVFFGDHGYHLGEHNSHWGKVTLYELSARVPMSIYYPGMQTSGQSTQGVVELVDIYPTLAELAGLKPPFDLEGESLKKLIDDPTGTWVNEAFIYEGNDVDQLQYSVVTDRYRFTNWADRNPVRYELYDHKNDPGEHFNLVYNMDMDEIKKSKYADIVADMERRTQAPTDANEFFVPTRVGNSSSVDRYEFKVKYSKQESRLKITAPGSRHFTFKLHDVNGQLFRKGTSYSIDVKDLAGGLYFLSIESERGSQVHKVWIQI